MTALYLIGTQLITRRLSQAALAHEFGFLIETKSTFADVWVKGFYRIILNPRINPNEQDGDIVCKEAEEWRVTVTAENQKWLSPAFVLELNNAREIIDSKTTYTQEVKDAVYDAFFELGYHRVLRTYPNGQRAPLIEWDEVLLPEGAIA